MPKSMAAGCGCLAMYSECLTNPFELITVDKQNNISDNDNYKISLVVLMIMIKTRVILILLMIILTVIIIILLSLISLLL